MGGLGVSRDVQVGAQCWQNSGCQAQWASESRAQSLSYKQLEAGQSRLGPLHGRPALHRRCDCPLGWALQIQTKLLWLMMLFVPLGLQLI